MRFARNIAAVVAAITVAASSVSAQVVANGPVNGFGTFRDTQTDMVWLRLDSFFHLSPNQMVASANAAGFTLANASQVQTLWQSLPLSGGEWSSHASIIGSAPNRALIWGLYDAGDTQSQGWGYAYSGDTQWNAYVAGDSWDVVQNAGSGDADLNLWAYQSSQTTVPEPSTVFLVASGIVAVGVARRRKQR